MDLDHLSCIHKTLSLPDAQRASPNPKSKHPERLCMEVFIRFRSLMGTNNSACCCV